MQDTIQSRFLRVVRKRPDRACIIHGDRIYSFKETNERINAMANAFLEMGVRKGDKIAAGLYNCPQLIETWMAAFKIGAVAVNINYRLNADEIRHVLADSGTRILVLDEDLVGDVNEIRPQLPGLEKCIVVGEMPEPPMLAYEELVRTHPKSEPNVPWEVRSDDLAQLFYTGGTTGMPKGVMHTHASNLGITDAFSVNGILMGAFRAIATGEGYKDVIDAWLGIVVGLAPHVPHFVVTALAATLKTEAARRILANRRVDKAMRKTLMFLWKRPPAVSNIMPMKHLIASPIIHGVAWWGGGLICPVTGFTLVLLGPKHFDAAEALRMVEKHRVNLLGLVGDKFSRMILRVPDIDSYDCSSLAMIGSSGAHWTAEVKAELHKHFPYAMLIDHLGSTESPAVSTGVYFRGDEYRKLGPGDVEVKVVDEDGHEVAPGESGTILVKSDVAGIGYYGDEEKSKETWGVEDGWVSTGDSGTIDEKGNIIIFGRGSEIIISGGVKIWAEEVESAIGQHAGVQDVIVFGIPDPEWGESVMAAVVAKPGESLTEQEIADFVKERIASFKKPRYVAFVDELPELPFGKIRRGVVKEMFKDYLAQRGSL